MPGLRPLSNLNANNIDSALMSTRTVTIATSLTISLLKACPLLCPCGGFSESRLVPCPSPSPSPEARGCFEREMMPFLADSRGTAIQFGLELVQGVRGEGLFLFRVERVVVRRRFLVAWKGRLADFPSPPAAFHLG